MMNEYKTFFLLKVHRSGLNLMIVTGDRAPLPD